jgi:hypothetical protein
MDSTVRWSMKWRFVSLDTLWNKIALSTTRMALGRCAFSNEGYVGDGLECSWGN